MLTVLTFFIGAQVVLWAVIRLGVGTARREPSLRGRLTAVTEVTHRPTRVEIGRKEIARSRSEIESVDRRLARARQRLNEMIPMAESPGSALGFAVLAFILYEGESAVALLLNLAARLGNMSDAVAAFFSPIIAAALFAGLHVIIGSIITIGAKHRPERVMIRAKIGAAVTGLAVIVASWAVLSGRSLTDPQLIENVASIGLMVLALLLSVAGACSSLVVTTVNGERALERQVSRLEALKTALERHLEAVQRDLTQHERPSVSLAAVTSIVLAILLVHPAGAQTRQSFVAPNSCEVLIDVSRSVDDGARQEAIERFATLLNTIARIFQCQTVRASAFSGEPPFNALREVTLPAGGDTALCTNVAPVDLSATKRAVQMLYPSVGAAHQDAAVRDCLAREQGTRDAALRDRQATLDATRVMLKDLTRTRPRGNCTALNFAVHGAVRRSEHIFVFTDGANSCKANQVRAPITLERMQTLTFLLVPSAADNAPVLGLLYASRLESTYPSARVVFASEATPALWKALKPGQ